MNKKTYIKPLTQSVELSHSSILCASLPDDSIVVFASSCARHGCFAHGANKQVGVAKVCFAEGDVVFTLVTNEHETYASRNFLYSCKQHNACAWTEA